jgi:hypothetical protein
MDKMTTAREELLAWAAHCAKRAKETPGPQFEEPELTKIRLGWDRVVERLQDARKTQGT